MPIVKLIFANPNVRISVLTAALALTAAPAYAGYTVVDDDGPVGLEQNSSISVPFYLAHYHLGPRGRAAMNEAYHSALSCKIVEIVARGDKEGEPFLSRKRASTMKDWLVAKGIPTSKINIRIEAAPHPDKHPKVYLAEIKFDPQTSTPQTVYADTISPPVAYQPSPQPSAQLNNQQLIANILELHRDGQISTDAAVKLLASMDQPKQLQTPISLPPIHPLASTWVLQEKTTLKDDLNKWAQIAGWNQPDWKLSDPYYVDQTLQFNGTLIDAVTQLSQGLPGLDFLISRNKHTITVTKAKP
jgi:hypothetical protein